MGLRDEMKGKSPEDLKELIRNARIERVKKVKFVIRKKRASSGVAREHKPRVGGFVADEEQLDLIKDKEKK